MIGRTLAGAFVLLALTASSAQAADELAITSTPRVDAPRGFFGKQPLHFSYAVRNQTIGPLAVAQFVTRVTAFGVHYDVPCTNGTDVVLGNGGSFTCDAPKPDGYDVFGQYSYWVGWKDHSGGWHEVMPDGAQHFTLTTTPLTTIGGTGGWNVGNQQLGGASDTPVTLTNTGSELLLIDGLGLNQLGEFSITGETCTQAAIVPNGSCTVTVHFAPLTVGSRAATLLFNANTSPANNAVSLLGTGVAAPVASLPTPVVTLPAPIKVAPEKLAVTLGYDYVVHGHTTKFSSLVVKGVPTGATVKVSCPHGCSTKSLVTTKTGNVSLKKFVGKALKAGTKITVKVTKPGATSVTKTLTVRAGKRPQLKG